jgi:hypothetical protein
MLISKLLQMIIDAGAVAGLFLAFVLITTIESLILATLTEPPPFFSI